MFPLILFHNDPALPVVATVLDSSNPVYLALKLSAKLAPIQVVLDEYT